MIRETVRGQSQVRKAWGWAKQMLLDETIEVVRIEVVPGGYCSWHFHQAKHNLFAVLEGELEVTFEDGERHTTVLRPGNPPLCIDARVVHRFFARSAVVAQEIYLPVASQGVSSEDIVRLSPGGVAKPEWTTAIR